MQSLKGQRLVLATHNQGKAREIRELLAPLGIDIVSAADLNLPEPEETGATFAENAILKAEAAAQATGLPALADDSGLAVNALQGQPGIYSARWAGPQKDFAVAMERVWRELNGQADKSASFICVLALARPDGARTQTFEGRLDGTIVWPPRGDKGFGYDPVFIPEGGRLTFAEIAPAEKQAISHRARAFRKFVTALTDAA